MYQIGWSGRVDPDQNIFNDWYPGAGAQLHGRGLPGADQRAAASPRGHVHGAAAALYTQAVQLMRQERNIIYLWYDKYFLAVSKTVTGVQYFPDG